MKSSKILKQLVALGYDTEEEYEEYQLIRTNTIKRKKFWTEDEIGETEFQINFNKQSLAHCCGVYEIGELTINSHSHVFEKSERLLEVLNLFIQWVFLYEKERDSFNKKIRGIKRFKTHNIL
jgi:hypothetical protein